MEAPQPPSLSSKEPTYVSLSTHTSLDSSTTPLPIRKTRSSLRLQLRELPASSRQPLSDITSMHTIPDAPATWPPFHNTKSCRCSYSRQLPGLSLRESSHAIPSMNASPDASANTQNRETESPDHRSASVPLPSSRRSVSLETRGEIRTTDNKPDPLFYFRVIWRYIIVPLLKYLLTTVGYVGYWMQPYLALGLAMVILWFALSYAAFTMQTTMSATLAPLCNLPGSSYLSMCAHTSTTPTASQAAPFDDLMAVQGTLADVLSSAKDTSMLPSTMKESELGFRQVRSIVRHTQLPSRPGLINELDNFIETARQASQDLTVYNSKLTHLVNRVIRLNKSTRETLEGIAEKEVNTSSLERLLDSINPWKLWIAPIPDSQQLIFQRYVTHISLVKPYFTDPIKRGESLLAALNSMEDKLDDIANIAVEDDVKITTDREILLSQLWTKLGGHQVKRKPQEGHLNILSQLMHQKRLAASHVGTTLLKLNTIVAELGKLQETANATGLVPWDDSRPWTLHFADIEDQIEQFTDFARTESP
ncbi:hypothetical protein BU24DRAFT_162295 [Aaosphaeria arxii CBS 175.79]|uniref:Uncharacterized protein n=1 Tax=Aaosphaeria arxii CBS 175.79 TaxID=1450172 RepID=A0A6A5Y049_9PLEO|nr:uncharacterized protein BU24DRAFT_162295 [Aaosphaeria arxii CBS 175.79]KAF2017934.1 hypothetical protein BU24DRAFT_162295 [Aaosphaeria arxii CBS 175.79]